MADLLFYRGSGLIDALVRDIEHGQFSHVACRINETEVVEAIVSGVRVRPFDAAGADREAVAVPCALNAAWLRAQVGKPYDFTALAADLASGLLPAGVHLYDSRQGTWDCSRLAAVAAGLDTLGERGPVTPQQLYDIVTKGNLT